MNKEIDLRRNCSEVERRIKEINNEILSLKHEKSKLLSELEQIKIKLLTEQVKTASNIENKFLGEFPWTARTVSALINIFGFQNFRPMQQIAINATLSGTDVLLIMPTGAGKSLIYQLPALMDLDNGDPGGFTLVISPLVSLMADQTMSLSKKAGIPVGAVRFFDSQTSRHDQNEIFEQMAPCKKLPIGKSPLRLLFVTPEKIVKSKRLKSKLDAAYSLHNSYRTLRRIAIDEVHCISQWGHDFRPDYKALHILKRQYCDVPIVGLTATASIDIILDIQKVLSLNPQECLVLRTGCNRPNLNYKIVYSDFNSKDLHSKQEILELLKSKYAKQCGIIYCHSIKDTEDLAAFLKTAKILAAPYHATLDSEVRTSTHRFWSLGNIDVIVATVAFGMGIDKPDVRFVLHYSSSRSLETYYQESGRAGRDGHPADCVIFWRFTDFFRLASLVYTEQANSIEKLLVITKFSLDLRTCRRKVIADCLGDSDWSPQYCISGETCDNCSRIRNNETLITANVANILRRLNELLSLNEASKDQRVTGPKLVELAIQDSEICTLSSKFLATAEGSENCEFKESSSKRRRTEQFSGLIQSVILSALVMKRLTLEFHFTPYSTIAYVVSCKPDQSLNDLTLDYMCSK